jgi:hypothetical protein
MPSSNSGLRQVAGAPRFCSNCGHPVVVGDARFCKDCGASLGSGLRFKQDLAWNPWVAMTLSLVPGLGQFYKGQRLYAVLWFFGVSIAYGAGLFGVLVHLVCIANAGIGGALEFPQARFSASGADGNSRAGS